MDPNYIRRLEQANEDLRRRNGELYVALDEAGLANKLTPVEGKLKGPLAGGPYKNFPTRYYVLDRVVSLATELALELDFTHGTGPAHADRNLAQQLVEAVSLHQSYWIQTARERTARSKAGKKAAASRKK